MKARPKLVTREPMIPNGKPPYLSVTPPDISPQRCSFGSVVWGLQIGLGRVRQNQHDGAMVKDPLMDFEEVA